MSSMREFKDALDILAKYSKKGLDTSYFFEPAHDIIYSHIGIEKVSPEDAALLVSLGWHRSSDVGMWAYFT